MAELPFDFTPPGGQFSNLIGDTLTAGATLTTFSKMIHHITGTTAIQTMVPPNTDGFSGPVYLVADSVFSWTTSGNIGAANATTVVAGAAYGFIYDRANAKWYPIT